MMSTSFSRLTALAALAIVATSLPAAAAPASSKLVATYNLAPGASSKPIHPPANIPVLVMGVQTALGYRGVGQVTLLAIPNNFLEWAGYDSTAGTALTEGFSGAAGTHMVWIDFLHQVDLQVNDANTFVVHNGSSGQRTGQVTLVW